MSYPFDNSRHSDTSAGQALPDIAAHYREYLLRSEQLRAVRDGIAEGLSVEAVADSVGMAVETVTEMAESLDRGADVDISPYEVIVKAHVEGTSRRELVDLLSAFEYTENRSLLPWPMQGAVFGTWRAVERASQVQGLLSFEELEEVRSRRGPLTQEPPIDWGRGRKK